MPEPTSLAARVRAAHNPYSTKSQEDIEMAIKTRRDFYKEATKEPYQLQLESDEIVTFKDPNDWMTEDAFDKEVQENPRLSLEKMLGDDFDKAWAELRYWKVGETGRLLEAVGEHYTGATKSGENGTS